MTLAPLNRASWAWYQAPIHEFLTERPETVIGRITQASDFAVGTAQANAWQAEIALLKEWLAGLSGEVLLEFTIPRMGSRIDAVVLIGPMVFVVEFKVGADDFDRSAVEQVWDYALDLKNFHEASHVAPIIPILVATEALTSLPVRPSFAEGGVCRPLKSIRAEFATHSNY